MGICQYEEVCGGCQLQHLSYEEQLEKKQAFIESLLSRFGPVEPIIRMDHPTHYRNKIENVVGTDKWNHYLCGNYAKGTHHIVHIDSCMLNDELMNEIRRFLVEQMIALRIEPFQERTRKGCMRHVMLRYAQTTKQVMVVFVTSTTSFPKKEMLVRQLVKRYPMIQTVIHNINPANTSQVLGKEEYVLYGPGFIEDVLCGYRFCISAKSFYQVNQRQTEILYQTAIQMAKFTKDDIVLDAYCGIGTIGMCLSRQVKEVLGVEVNASAIEDAKKNAKRNHVENITFVCQDAGQYMVKRAKSNQAVDVVMMDPPRAGADKAFLTSMCQLAPKRVVYISCNPKTLKENLLYLTKHQYEVVKIQPVDMFPFTDHVETVVLMSKKA